MSTPYGKKVLEAIDKKGSRTNSKVGRKLVNRWEKAGWIPIKGAPSSEQLRQIRTDQKNRLYYAVEAAEEEARGRSLTKPKRAALKEEEHDCQLGDRLVAMIHRSTAGNAPEKEAPPTRPTSQYPDLSAHMTTPSEHPTAPPLYIPPVPTNPLSRNNPFKQAPLRKYELKGVSLMMNDDSPAVQQPPGQERPPEVATSGGGDQKRRPVWNSPHGNKAGTHSQLPRLPMSPWLWDLDKRPEIWAQ